MIATLALAASLHFAALPPAAHQVSAAVLAQRAPKLKLTKKEQEQLKCISETCSPTAQTCLQNCKSDACRGKCAEAMVTCNEKCGGMPDLEGKVEGLPED